ncbi:carbohydrate ABC transporter permease [Cohnella cellulosilytica]|uniref:Carbohydrate ABC transporter permease n=1 Tax=Cohnella cellulosilytica TaxID=986710 RepID=A0ABW2FBW6_9BACL
MAEQTSNKSAVKWRESRSTAELIYKCFISLVLLCGAVVLMIPLLWMISTSLKSLDELYEPGFNLWVEHIKWDNYSIALSAFPFWLYLKNTLLTTLIPIVGTVLSSSLIAFGFARVQAPGAGILFMVVLATMMIPEHVTMIPTFILFRQLGWIDSLYPLIVPAFFGSAFFIFLFRQFYMRLPMNMDDAARIDGCNTFQIWHKIFLPLSQPAIATVAIFVFMGKWNDFFSPLIYINSDRWKTLALGLRSFQGQYTTEVNLLMAASLVVILPCIVLFFFAQRYFIEGITFTGSKE